MTPPGLPMGRPRSSQITASAGSRGMGAGTTATARLAGPFLGVEPPEVLEDVESEAWGRTSEECCGERPSSSDSSSHGTTVISEPSLEPELSCTAFMGAWKARAALTETTDDLRDKEDAAPTELEQTEERRRWELGFSGGAKGVRGPTMEAALLFAQTMEEVLLFAHTAWPSDATEEARLTAAPSSSLAAGASGCGSARAQRQTSTRKEAMTSTGSCSSVTTASQISMTPGELSCTMTRSQT
mmetsp:Transcript_51326/g.155446  ORF Transcript_51326/g.155446 Transcript_51326/m.155446 type:complete len:242 (-) Transcript_51326:646-1371(-)